MVTSSGLLSGGSKSSSSFSKTPPRWAWHRPWSWGSESGLAVPSASPHGSLTLLPLAAPWPGSRLPCRGWFPLDAGPGQTGSFMWSDLPLALVESAEPGRPSEMACPHGHRNHPLCRAARGFRMVTCPPPGPGAEPIASPTLLTLLGPVTSSPPAARTSGSSKSLPSENTTRSPPTAPLSVGGPARSRLLGGGSERASQGKSPDEASSRGEANKNI